MPAIKPLHIAYILCGIAWLVVVVNRTAETYRGPYSVRPPTVSQEELSSLARSTLSELQTRSFSEDREFCGLLLEDEEGNLSVSEIYVGDAATCSFNWDISPEKFAVASFHTHGGFSREYDSEVPSILDLEGDIADRIDGYVSTPGGRLWHVDWDEEQAKQICGEDCLPRDPDYERCDAIEPAATYTVRALKARHALENLRC